MAGTDEDDDSPSPSPSAISIGNCKVEFEGNGVACEWHTTSLHISFPSTGGKIKISDTQSKDKDISFILLDPKDIDSESKSLLQQVLRLYIEELPEMNYATKSRSKSQYLERCIFDGKYKTLTLMFHEEGCIDVIATLSYQIVPSDTRYAEIPLVAVGSLYHQKGIGQILYNELRERLESVGITTIFCWAGEMSEWFWLKQGFTSIGGIDTEGKVRKLPIRANIKRALSFPRGSILMVAHAKNTRSLTKSPPIRRLFHNIDLQETTAGPSEPVGMLCNISLVDIRGQFVKSQILECSPYPFKSKRAKMNEGVRCDNYLMQSSGPRSILQVLSEQSKGSRSDSVLKQNLCKIMFMNMADDHKRTSLTKMVEELGGSVTSDGSVCTHVITGIARKTLNFSVALSSGAWIVSPNWLKKSFEERKFIGESEFITEDEEYLLYYKTPLRAAVALARANPHSLLRGYHICIAKHIHPPPKILSTIIQSAGGNIIPSLGSVKDPSKTIFLASEEDISDAFTAVEMGAMTFTSDWLMDCVMTQQLDLEASQFVVSLG